MSALKFAALSSDIELPFYTSLAFHKINHDKLNDSARRVLGLYEIRPNDTSPSSCRLQIHGNALTSDESVLVPVLSGIVLILCSVPAEFYRAEGIIRNMNTIEDYRNMDKADVLNRAGRMVRPPSPVTQRECSVC